MDSKSLIIEGTSCDRCVLAVRGALQAYDGVQVTLVHSCSADLQFDQARTSEEELLDVISIEGFARNTPVALERAAS